MLSFLIALWHNVQAQVVTVLDAESLKPLEMVAVSAPNSTEALYTDQRGEVNITSLTKSASLVFRQLGYVSRQLTKDELEAAKFKVYLSELALNLDQAVVSVNRWSQSKKDVPVKVTAIKAKDIALQNPQTAADLLGASGEVFIQKSQMGGGSPMIRGFSTNRLLITVDGIRMNTAIFRSGNLQNVISIDPFSVERAEVVFGPGSVNYGSDAIGGVMSFATLKPTLSPDENTLVRGNAGLRFASANNEQTAHADISIGFKKWGFLSSFTHNNFGDLRMGSYGPDDYLRPNYVQALDSSDIVVRNTDPQVQSPTAYQQTSMMHKIKFKPNAAWDLNFGFNYSATSNYPRYDRLLRTRNGDPRSARWDYGPQIWMMNQLSIAHKRKTTLYDEMTIRAAYQFFEESRFDRDFQDTEERERLEYVDAYSLNLDFKKQLNDKHLLYYGAEAVINEVDSKGYDRDILNGSVARASSRYPDATWSSYAVFASYQYSPSEKLNISAGARFNTFALDATFDTSLFSLPFNEASLNSSAVTGSLGLVYEPVRKLTFSLHAGTGFRAPNVDDVGKIFDSEPGRVVVPNPDLSAEYAYNIEAGIGKIFGDVVKLDLTGYYTILEDALVRRDYLLDGQDSIFYDGELSGVQAIQNASSATVYGAQASLEIKFAKGFGLRSRLSYQLGEEELDDGSTAPLRHAAPWFGNTAITYTAPKTRIELYAMYSGEFSYDDLPPSEQGKDYLYALDEDGRPYSPSWTTINLKINYQLDDMWSVSGGLENMADVRYRPYSSGIAAPGRNLILAVKARF